MIIAGVTINVAIGGKLFDKSQDAVDRTNDRISQGDAIIDEIMNDWEEMQGSGTGGGTGERPDTTPPEGEIIINKITENSIAITVNARDLESGLAKTETFAYYINSESTARYTGTNNTYTYQNLAQNTNYTIRVKIKDQAGNECEITKQVTTEKEIITAAVVDQNPMIYYGKEVKNYGVIYDNTSEATNKWRIFYADEENIYLIADDYIHYDYAPKGAKGTSLVNNTDYQLAMHRVFEDYTGLEDIDSVFANKWLSEYYKNNSVSANINMRAITFPEAIKGLAYMLDMNVWNPIYKNSYAEYAIGGPTLEMFCKSYKDTHPTDYIEYSVNFTGYLVRWSGGSYYSASISEIPEDEYNSIYIKSNTTKADNMWLASPSDYNMYSLMTAGFNLNDGDINYRMINVSLVGFRPIVCLRSEIQLESTEDGNYRIVE